MADRPWKAEERHAAALIGGRRHPASSGGPVDAESSWAVAQCKHVRRLSLAELEGLALEAERQGAQRRKIGLVVVRRRAGRGRPTPTLVVMTAAAFRDPCPGSRQATARCGLRGVRATPMPTRARDLPLARMPESRQ